MKKFLFAISFVLGSLYAEQEESLIEKISVVIKSKEIAAEEYIEKIRYQDNHWDNEFKKLIQDEKNIQQLSFEIKNIVQTAACFCIDEMVMINDLDEELAKKVSEGSMSNFGEFLRIVEPVVLRLLLNFEQKYREIQERSILLKFLFENYNCLEALKKAIGDLFADLHVFDAQKLDDEFSRIIITTEKSHKIEKILKNSNYLKELIYSQDVNYLVDLVLGESLRHMAALDKGIADLPEINWNDEIKNKLAAAYFTIFFKVLIILS